MCGYISYHLEQSGIQKMKAKIVEILDSYTKEEIANEMNLWESALQKKDAWDALSDREKDRMFETSEQ